MILIDGGVHPDPESDLSTGPDGLYPPFYLFDTGLQEHVSGPIPTREVAERLLALARPFAAYDPLDEEPKRMKTYVVTITQTETRSWTLQAESEEAAVQQAAEWNEDPSGSCPEDALDYVYTFAAETEAVSRA